MDEGITEQVTLPRGLVFTSKTQLQRGRWEARALTKETYRVLQRCASTWPLGRGGTGDKAVDAYLPE